MWQSEMLELCAIPLIQTLFGRARDIESSIVRVHNLNHMMQPQDGF